MTNNSTVISWLTVVWDNRDKRLDGWPLMDSPLLVLFLTAVYVLVATKLGKLYMKNREAYNIKNIIIIFNLCMMIFNMYIVHQIWTLAWGNDYSWRCEPLDRSLSSRSLQIAATCWLFLICKFVDWFDTLFFIMRKKFGHVSGLHIYHHAVMPSFVWLGTRLMPGGQLTFGILLNGSIHTIMHFYYCIAAMGHKYQRYLWWKKYLTLLQLTQFVVGFIHASQAIYIDCGIDLPVEWAYPFIPQPILFFYLFYQFYQDNYNKKAKQKRINENNFINNKAKKL